MEYIIRQLKHEEKLNDIEKKGMQYLEEMYHYLQKIKGNK